MRREYSRAGCRRGAADRCIGRIGLLVERSPWANQAAPQESSFDEIMATAVDASTSGGSLVLIKPETFIEPQVYRSLSI